MVTKTRKIFGVIAAIAILLSGMIAFSQPDAVYASSLEGKGGPGGGGGAGVGIGTGLPGTGTALNPLSDAEKNALNEAILEEYGALNLYNSVVDQLGDVIPFSQIARSEQQHATILIRLAEKYGLTAPANPGLVNPPTFTTLASACQAGVDAEIADADLYDALAPDVTHTDILQVFNNLQSASLNSHLPAFEACN
ncbi:MAG: DUF2202 domain-containing protein [Anaerolineaceae bacterium]